LAIFSISVLPTGVQAEGDHSSLTRGGPRIEALIDGRWASVGVGDTVAWGTPIENGLCHFDDPGIQVRDPRGQPSASSSNRVQVNEDCTATVTSITYGPSADPSVRAMLRAAVAKERRDLRKLDRP
jgi:hypothetical protein